MLCCAPFVLFLRRVWSDGEQGLFGSWRGWQAAGLTHSQNANIICGMIKGQDILMLAALMGEEASELPYSELGRVACLSVSEAHASVRRLQESALINSMRRPVKRNVEEFLFQALLHIPLILL